MKKFRQFRSEADKEDYSSEFNANVDKTFIRLKQTIRNLEEQIDELQEKERRVVHRRTNGKTTTANEQKRRQKEVETEQKVVQKGELKAADFDLLGLDFGVTNSPKTSQKTTKMTPEKPVSVDILDLDFGTSIEPQTKIIHPQANKLDSSPTERSTNESAEKEDKLKAEPDFFDRIAIRQDHF